MAEAVAHYEQREQELGAPIMREVERQVMLRIVDQKWREHLEEMDYLREGINLRAMGQRDPLTEWQREGYSMFEAMMKGVALDFVRYAMQVQVNVQVQGQPAAGRRRRPTSARRRRPMALRRTPSPGSEPAGAAAGAVRRPTRADGPGPLVLRARRLRRRRRPVAGGGRDRGGRGRRPRAAAARAAPAQRARS